MMAITNIKKRFKLRHHDLLLQLPYICVPYICVEDLDNLTDVDRPVLVLKWVGEGKEEERVETEELLRTKRVQRQSEEGEGIGPQKSKGMRVEEGVIETCWTRCPPTSRGRALTRRGWASPSVTRLLPWSRLLSQFGSGFLMRSPACSCLLTLLRKWEGPAVFQS